MLGNNRGATLAELLVAMGLTGLLLLIIVSGVIFMQRTVGGWLGESREAADIATVGEAFSKHLSQARFVQSFADSLVVVSTNGRRNTIGWSDKKLRRNGKLLLSDEVRLNQVQVSQFSLRTTAQETIFVDEHTSYAEHSGLYQIEVSWTDSLHYGTIQTRYVVEATDRFLATQLAPRNFDSLGVFTY